MVLLFGATVLGLGFLVAHTHDEQVQADQLAHQAGKRKLEPLWSAPELDLPDQRGGRVSKASLIGRPWVVNFIFTTCKSVCPLLTAKMVQLRRQLTVLFCDLANSNYGSWMTAVDQESTGTPPRKRHELVEIFRYPND